MSFRLLVPLRGLRHNYLEGTEQKLTGFERVGNAWSLSWEKLSNRNGRLDISVTQKFELGPEPGEVQITTQIRNKSEHTVEEVWSPMVGGFCGVGNPGRTRFIASLWDGSFPADGQVPLSRFPSNAPYWNEMFDYLELAYPWEMSMQWVDFYNDESSTGVYLASHDKSAQVTFFHFQLQPGAVQRDRISRWPTPEEAQGAAVGMVCSVAKLPYIRPGETWTSAPACIHVHRGDWHSGAERYRRWADTWLRVAKRPRWVGKGLSLQSNVMSWPDDLVAYRFSDIPKLAEDAAMFGINAIQVIGYHRGGLDRGYPDYRPDPRLGTEEELRQGIAKANRLGVKVLLFVNDQVADTTRDDFDKRLTGWAAKDMFGKVRRLGYGMHTLAEKSGWGFHQLALMCPSAKPFQDLLVRQFERAAERGANGLQVDKLGDYGLCYDEGHGHRPAEAFSKGIADFLRKTSAECRKHDLGFLLMGEACYDFCLQYMNASYMRLGRDHVPVLRFTFPEALVTVCVHQFDFDSVNNCLRVGYVINAEIDNLRSTLASAPKLGEYIKEVLRLREGLADYLWNGRFRDNLGAALSGETGGVSCGVFLNKDGRRAVVLMNAGDASRNVKLKLEGGRGRTYTVHAPFGGAHSQPVSRAIRVEAHRVAVAVED